jgi:hypothetical protein
MGERSELDLLDFDTNCRVFIIDSASSSLGYNEIKNFLRDQRDLPRAERIRYGASSGLGEIANSPVGKFLVHFEPDLTNGGGTVRAYFGRDTPFLTQRYDRNGNEC